MALVGTVDVSEHVRAMDVPLHFEQVARCGKTRARVGVLHLKSTCEFGRDVLIQTPVFMPVGTSGALKCLPPSELSGTGCGLMLANTYHLASQPGEGVVAGCGGLHGFMRWRGGVLTDSGGFQMVSLSKLMEVSEAGVLFQSPYREGQVFLSPEKCVRVQHQLASNIMMQLDDVVSSTHQDESRFELALHRSLRWYDRCRKEHHAADRHRVQNLFPIIQGGLSEQLRRISVREVVARDPPGIAVGGLSGGEDKSDLVRMVAVSTEALPEHKPRYLMGVGYALDMLLAVALGCDMFDCVYPSRTARFGTALVGLGRTLALGDKAYLDDHGPVCAHCDCATCLSTTRSQLCHLLRSRNSVACHLLTAHNIRFQMRFMQLVRDAIRRGQFEQFLLHTLQYHFGPRRRDYPDWVSLALRTLHLE